MKLTRIAFIVCSILLCDLPGLAQTGSPLCPPDKGVDFQIATDKLVYAPKSRVHVKFLVTNTDYVERQNSVSGLQEFRSLYLRRVLSACTTPLGFFWLTVLDKQNKDVPIQRCSADVVLDKLDAVKLFTDPKSGIALTPGEVYGSEDDFELPAKAGIYRLEATLFTGAFNEKQLQTLAERHIHVLPPGCDIRAPVMTVTVK